MGKVASISQPRGRESGIGRGDERGDQRDGDGKARERAEPQHDEHQHHTGDDEQRGSRAPAPSRRG